eukprot:Awhi_evm1s13556
MIGSEETPHNSNSHDHTCSVLNRNNSDKNHVVYNLPSGKGTSTIERRKKWLEMLKKELSEAEKLNSRFLVSDVHFEER